MCGCASFRSSRVPTCPLMPIVMWRFAVDLYNLCSPILTSCIIACFTHLVRAAEGEEIGVVKQQVL